MYSRSMDFIENPIHRIVFETIASSNIEQLEKILPDINLNMLVNYYSLILTPLNFLSGKHAREKVYSGFKCTHYS